MSYKLKIDNARKQMHAARLNKHTLLANRWLIVLQTYSHLLMCGFRHSHLKTGRKCPAYSYEEEI